MGANEEEATTAEFYCRHNQCGLTGDMNPPKIPIRSPEPSYCGQRHCGENTEDS